MEDSKKAHSLPLTAEDQERQGRIACLREFWAGEQEAAENCGDFKERKLPCKIYFRYFED